MQVDFQSVVNLKEVLLILEVASILISIEAYIYLNYILSYIIK